jgi:RNA polymerase sigma-70 factor (ECF subfamily)
MRLQNAKDVAAWDEFVELYGPVVYRSARRRGLQPADAENLVQQVLLAVTQSVSDWLLRDDRGRFRAWLLCIARNEAVNMLTLRAPRSLEEDGAEAMGKIEESPAFEEISALVDLEYQRAVFRWAAECVQKVVAPNTWQAFWLTHVEDLSIEQAAAKLGTRPGNIHFGRSRVMARIRQLVQQYEECDDRQLNAM